MLQLEEIYQNPNQAASVGGVNASYCVVEYRGRIEEKDSEVVERSRFIYATNIHLCGESSIRIQ